MKIFKRLSSEEYLKLMIRIQELEVRMKSLELDLELYTKRLKISKGLTKKPDEEDNENNLNKVILPT